MQNQDLPYIYLNISLETLGKFFNYGIMNGNFEIYTYENQTP